MKLYVEIDIEEGAETVLEALNELSSSIADHVRRGTGNALERRTMDEYRNIHPALVDIDVR